MNSPQQLVFGESNVPLKNHRTEDQSTILRMIPKKKLPERFVPVEQIRNLIRNISISDFS